MSDLIDRQAAIDALLHNQEVYSNNFGDDPIDKYTVAIIDNDVQTIAQLPSTQTEIIMCKDCEWFRKEYGWNCIEYTVCGVSPTYHPIRREEDFCSYAERRTDERSYQQARGD